MNARRIDEHHLAFGFRDYTLNLESCRLRFIGNRRDLLPHESIQQRRLPAFGRPTNATYPLTRLTYTVVLICEICVQWLTLLREDLDQVDQRLSRFFQSASRVEFQLTVKVAAAREKVWRRQSLKR